jgi:hypothetical protein
MNECFLADIVMTKHDKRALVFVNPAGGSGKAYNLVMEYVVGVWGESEFKYHMVVTGWKRNKIRISFEGFSLMRKLLFYKILE